MKTIRKIALTELQSLFYSPIAWLVLIIFTVMGFNNFTEVMGGVVRAQDLGHHRANITFETYYGFFETISSYLYLYIPLLTMGLISRELSSGSIKLLYSSPVRNSQIILGKFLSMVIFAIVMVGLLSIAVLWGWFTVENFDWTVPVVGLAGIFLLICAYSAVGLFMSSLTSYQIVAAIGTFIVLGALNYIAGIGQSIDFVREVTHWVHMAGRSSLFYMGMLSSEDLLYFLLIISLFLALTIIRLSAVRQKERAGAVWGKYAGIVLGVFLVGWVTSRPALRYYNDTTDTKALTLTPQSQDIIARATGPLTITTYVNIFDRNVFGGLPQARISDLASFDQYRRFKPEIKMKYVYYYAMQPGSPLQTRYKGMTEQDIVGKLARNFKTDSALFKPLESLDSVVQRKLADEHFRFVRFVQRSDGQEGVLRVFDDANMFPGEREISAMLKGLVMDLPKVGFTMGQGERSINASGERGYFLFSHLRNFRHSLRNQGFDVRSVRLGEPVPEDINILVVSDMRTPFDEREQANFDAFVARGGNLMIMGDVGRDEAMNPMMAGLGVRLLPGQIVRRPGAGADALRKQGIEPDSTRLKAAERAAAAYGERSATVLLRNGKPEVVENQLDNNAPNVVVAHLLPNAGELAYGFEGMLQRRAGVVMDGASALAWDSDKGFDVQQLMISDSLDSWVSTRDFDFVNDTVRIAEGEHEGISTLALSLTRSVNGKEQKILVFGDADALSNGELGRTRQGIRAENYNMILSAFYWFSDHEVPLDIRRPSPRDNNIELGLRGMKWSKIILVWVLPAMLLAACLIIWLRRRSR